MGLGSLRYGGLRARPAHVYDARTYGATGGGVTADDAAIQRAIDAAETAGGGVVHLAAGTFLINAAVIIPSKVTLAGAGAGATTIKGSFASGTAYMVSSDMAAMSTETTDVCVRDLTIDRTGTNSQHGMTFRNTRRLLIAGVRIVGSPASTGLTALHSGALNVGGFASPQPYEGCSDVRVVGCHFESADNFGVQFGGIRNGLVTGCTFTDCFREAIGVEPGSGLVAENVTVVGNAVQSGPTRATPSSQTGIIVVTVSSGGSLRGVTVAGNVIDNDDPLEGDVNPGIRVIGGSGVVIQGNTVRNANGPGIYLGNATIGTSGCAVVGNSVLDCNQGSNSSPNGAGIGLRGSTTTGNLVTANVIIGAAHTVAIEETSSATGNTLSGNVT